ncbi:MAG: hypothetical protein ACP5QA_08710 [Phycisphaerae bacterium]
MTLFFLHPGLLVLPVLVAAGGWFLLPRAGITQYPFTLLEFWPEETSGAAGRWKARPDWPWIFILIAAVLAALALCSPRLKTTAPKNTAAPSITLHAIGRSLPRDNQSLDVFIQSRNIPRNSSYLVILTTHQQILRRRVSAAMLKAGIDISPVSATPRIAITLKQDHRIIAQKTLQRESGTRPIAGHFIGTPLSVFLRLFAAMREVTLHGHAADPSIWIVHQRRFNPKILQGISHSAIVLLGDTPGPGLKPGAVITLNHAGPLTALTHHGLMQAVDPSRATVRRFFSAQLNSHWHRLMTIQGHTWLAERRDAPRGQTWLWLAGPMDSEWTTWPDHASFVIFFANFLAQLQKSPSPDGSGNWWQPTASHPKVLAREPKTSVRTMDLNIELAVLACVCLISGVLTLALRARTLQTNPANMP